MTATDPLALALDRFDVPPMSAGLTNRIVAATVSVVPMRSAPRHDRRGLWRRGRQVVIGTVAAGMLSAAAVASGLLDHSGIEVPVLTAMLSPAHRHAAKVHHEHKVAVAAREHKQTPATPKPVGAPAPAAPLLPAAPASPAQPTTEQLVRRELAVERRDARIAFAQTHPRAAAIIARRQRQRMLRDQPLNPSVLDPALQGFQSPEFRAERTLAIEARRNRRAALGLPVNPMGKPGQVDANGLRLADENRTTRSGEKMVTPPSVAVGPAPAAAPALEMHQQERRAQMQRVATQRQALRQQIAVELRAERQARRQQNVGGRPLRFRP